MIIRFFKFFIENTDYHSFEIPLFIVSQMESFGSIELLPKEIPPDSENLSYK